MLVYEMAPFSISILATAVRISFLPKDWSGFCFQHRCGFLRKFCVLLQFSEMLTHRVIVRGGILPPGSCCSYQPLLVKGFVSKAISVRMLMNTNTVHIFRNKSCLLYLAPLSKGFRHLLLTTSPVYYVWCSFSNRLINSKVISNIWFSFCLRSRLSAFRNLY